MQSFSRTARVSAAAVFALGIAFWIGSPARSHDIVAAEMMPLDDDIAQHMEAITEIKRQGQNYVTHISRWIGWWTKIKGLATETGDKLKKDFDERIEKAQQAKALLSQLFVEKPEDGRYLPGFGWQSAGSMAQAVNTVQQELGNWTKLIAEGKASWHIAAVGWITGEGIQKVIDDKQKQITDINQKMADGTLEVHIAGYGWVNERNLKGAIAALEQRKRDIQQKISSGDYEVAIPGIGVRTRKTLDAEIAAVEAELQSRRDILARGDMSIWRPAIEWKTLTQLRQLLESDATSYEVMKKTVNDGVYTVWLVETGWAKRVDLEGQVKSLEDQIANMKDAVQKGEYRPQTAIGWSSLNEIRKYVEDLGKQLNQPQLDAKTREYLVKQLDRAQKALTEWQALSAYDLLILGLEKRKYSNLITGVMKLARPDFERRDLERTDREEATAEYPIEGQIWIKQIERRLTRLKLARTSIPG